MCLSLPCRRVLGFEFGLGCFCGCWDLTCFAQLVVLWMLRVWRTSKPLLLCTCDLAPFARKKGLLCCRFGLGAVAVFCVDALFAFAVIRRFRVARGRSPGGTSRVAGSPRGS